MKSAWFGCLLILWMLPGAHAQEAQFDIFEFRVEGTRLLPAITVERAVYPQLGEKKTLANVEKASEALEKAYHDAGYLTVVVSIPQQKVDGGVVRLQVTEAPVERLRVVESRYFSLGQIKAGVPELAEGNVPNFSDMQDELAALNRSPDRRITPVLRPGKTPGTVEVDLKVQDTLPLHGSVELNNRYSDGSTPTHASASIRWDNLWEKQHSLGLTVQTVPGNPQESNVLSLNYTVPMQGGNILALYGVRSNSDVAAVGTLNVVGKGDILGLRYIVPLRGSDAFFHSATVGLDYKRFDQSVNLLNSGGFSTPITYMPWTVGWDGNWLGEGSTTRLGVSFVGHASGMVGSEQEFADKRYKGRSSFSYMRGNASHNQTQASGWGVNVRTSWQLSGQALVSNEQFALGGAETVRGYLESVAMGDSGVSASLELSTPNLTKHLSESLNEVRFLAFLDAGAVRVIDPITATERFNLSGLGLGLRVKGPQGLSVSLDWARALKDVGTTPTRGESHLYFKLGYDW